MLAAAMRADLMLPYGCRNGACGTCKGKILEGDVDYGPHQTSTLTEDEKRRASRCSAAREPLTDLVTIEVREVRRAGDIQIKRLPCRIESIDKAAPDVAIVRFKLPANERLQFLAGQYIDFLLKDGRRRSFSLATPPHDDELLELHIRHVPGGFFTDQLFTQYKGREILRFEGPLGTFYLREESDKPIIFVAGGTGFAPIKAIIEHALHHKLDREMVLYWGARAQRDLYLPRPAGHSGSSEHATSRTSRCCPSRCPRTMAGPHRLRPSGGAATTFRDLSGYQVYACGAPAMIDAARRDFTQTARLAARRVLRRQLHLRGAKRKRGPAQPSAGRLLQFGQRPALSAARELRVRRLRRVPAGRAARPARRACASGRRAQGSPRSTSAPCPTAARARTARPARTAASRRGCAAASQRSAFSSCRAPSAVRHSA